MGELNKIMKTIWKYTLDKGPNEFEMSVGSKILDIQMQHGIITLWALVNTEAQKIKRTFVLLGTGWDIEEFQNDTNLKYIKTVQKSLYVWHIFEVKG